MDKVKLKYQIYKDKVILFSTMFGSSFVGFFKYSNKYAVILLSIGVVLSLFGIVKNLHNIKLLEKDLEND